MAKKKPEERIITMWDGGERRRAAELAKEATKTQQEAAIKARPELAKYL